MILVPAARWPVGAAVILAVIAASIALSPLAGAAVKMATLQSLQVDLKTAAATSASIYQQAGRLLVRLAAEELADPRVRSAAVAAIRAVTRSSSRLSERSRQLSNALDPLPVGIPGTAEQLNEAVSGYRAAEQGLTVYGDELQRRINAIKATKSTDEFAVKLEAFSGSAEVYNKAAQTLDFVLGDLGEIILGRTRAPGGIRLSVYGFYDDRKGIEGDYGLYTHVLFGLKSNRNVALLETLLNTPPADLFADQPAAINVFALPVSSRVKAKLIARTSMSAPAELASPQLYNYERAKQILGQTCLGAGSQPPEFCSGQWDGPFLITYDQPLSRAVEVEPPYLIVDLTNINQSAFGEFVRAVQEQVMLSDFSNREKIDTFRLQLLDVTLKAADWLGPVKRGVGEVLTAIKGG